MLISLRNFSLALLVSLLIFGMLSFFVVGLIKDMIDDWVNPTLPTTPTTSSVTTTGIATDPTGKEVSSMTVLIAGVDSGASQFDGKLETDAILLLHIDAAGEKYMCSFLPPNMLVDMRGYSMPLGLVYSEYGAPALASAVKAYTGVAPSFYAIVDYTAFAKIIDRLGTVKFNVPFDMYHNPMGEEEPEFDIPAGTQELDGAGVLGLLRYKGYINGERGRSDMARSLLKEILSQKLVAIIKDLDEIYAGISAGIVTNMPGGAVDLATDLINAFTGPFSKDMVVDVEYPTRASEVPGGPYVTPMLEQALTRYKPYR